MTDLNETPQVSTTDEQAAPHNEPVGKGRASMLLRLFAGAVAGWSVWAFATSRGARFPVAALKGHDSLNLSYVLDSPINVLFPFILASTAMLFAKHKAVRILAIFVFPAASILLAGLRGTNPSWDPGAYIFVLIGLFAAVSVAATHKATSPRGYKLAAPVFALALVLLTQAASPGVPQSAYTIAVIPRDEDPAVEYKCDNPSSGYARQQDPVWSIMQAPSLCSDVAVNELSKAKDGCYSASEAYAHLALVQGSHADNPSLSALTAQTDLTGAWLRGRDEMESGFCVRTKNNVRTFTRSDGSGLFSAEVVEWGDIRD